MGVVFAERFNPIIRDFLGRRVFERGDANWINVLPVITKKCNDRVHTSNILRPIQASLKKIEGFVYHNLLGKRKEMKPKLQVNNRVRVADLKRTFSESDTTDWS